MTKSELIDRVAARQHGCTAKETEAAVNALLEHMVESLIEGERVEVRGFGSFSLHHRGARTGRNPKTGESVDLDAKRVPHFKPGKELRDRVNAAANTAPRR